MEHREIAAMGCVPNCRGGERQGTGRESKAGGAEDGAETEGAVAHAAAPLSAVATLPLPIGG